MPVGFIFFLIIGFLHFSLAEPVQENQLEKEELIKEELIGGFNRESYLLELERILKSYSLQAEKGLLFEAPLINPDEITVEFLDPIPNPDEIRVDILPPVSAPDENSSQQDISEEILIHTFENIIEKEKKHLKEKQEFERFLSRYHFLQNLKPHFYIMKELQGRIYQSFSDLNESVLLKNQIDKKIEEFNERYKKIEDKRGSLSFIEIEGFISFNRDQETFSSNGSFKSASSQTITYIRSLYDQIDSEKEKLLQLENPTVDILCGSEFYKTSRLSCLSVFELKDKKKLYLFIDSLSPEKWQALERRTQEAIGALNYQRNGSLKKSLWELAQKSDFSGMKTLFKTTDFFRWFYFSLREMFQERVNPNLVFSWDLILEKLKEDKQKKVEIEAESIALSLNEKQADLNAVFYSNQMREKEEEYFHSLILALSLIGMNLLALEVELQGTDVSCLVSNLNSASKWSDCIEKYFNFLVSQEALKETWEKELNKDLKELVASASSLKEYFENQSN